MNSKWKRVNKERPCPICHKPDWCAVSSDGAVALCHRIESRRRCGDAGWLHRIGPGSIYSAGRIRIAPLVRACHRDFSLLAAGYRDANEPGRLYQFAVSLGLTTASIGRFGVGWCQQYRAWSFPMVDADGRVVGIRLRRSDGSKFAVKGGREGLFVPRDRPVELAPLLITEGPTDAAALLEMGFANVIGRPSCTGGMKMVVQIIQRAPTDIVIVADNDEPGQRGAANLASVLAVYAPAVRVIQPPEGIKDARDWLRAGGTREDIERLIEAARVRRLQVKGVRQ